VMSTRPQPDMLSTQSHQETQVKSINSMITYK